MRKRTEYTLISAALVASALVGTAVGLNIRTYPSPVAVEPAPTVTVTPAPEVIVMDATQQGAPIHSHVG